MLKKIFYLNKFSNLFFIFFVSCGFTICVVAQIATADNSVDRKNIEQVAEESISKLIANVKLYTLDNGLRVVFYRRGTAPVFAGHLAVRVGGIDEPLGLTGVSHMFEHIAFKGTEEIGVSDPQLEKKLLAEVEKLALNERDNGFLSEAEKSEWDRLHRELNKIWKNNEFIDLFEAHGGSEMNATTDKELTQYFGKMPSNAFGFFAWFESERLARPSMRQFYKEREVVLEERLMRYGPPGGKLYEEFILAAFDLNPYRQPVIGFENDIRKLTATETLKFKERFYVPSNMVLAIVGDIDPSIGIEQIERYFSRLPKGDPPARNYLSEPAKFAEKRVYLKAKAPPSMYVGYHKPVYPDQDDAKLAVMTEILAGDRDSFLKRELIDRRKLALQVESNEGPGGLYPNLQIFFLVPQAPSDNHKLLAAFDELIERFKRDGPSAKELEIAKKSLAVSHLLLMNSNDGLARNLASMLVSYNNLNSILDWYHQLLLVDKEDVVEVARKYLRNEFRIVAQLNEDK
ncbi:MAG TPA: pitrilysin family protein [Oligoflexia bacterium]|nr:pitrilysin family protein [Oligoflexia bacterium]HMP27546.1 pitrilysin family protein [Oligoflexia bacterium]